MLKRNEELIAAKVSKEHLEETLRGEILFLKDQLHAEQHAKDTIEDTLTQEADTMRQQLGIQSSIKSELEREQKLRKDIEQHLNEAETTKKNIQAKGKQVIQTLQAQLEEQSASKVGYLQPWGPLSVAGSWGTMVVVMTLEVPTCLHVHGFMEGSQALTGHLDAYVLMSSMILRHCRHCGKVFCHDCTSKIVHSGPHRRQSKVCDVCHTLLVKDSAPYFSTEPPPTPT
ncbi:PREDICTED: RUN and FYVE domain-containing protein 1-like [Priapulus caudatus]|uniref:RUN and FYVE domain-containing protein 1-like n=1 Tax=Priapulus caudatus TaxID=37621 RepID=A0ABM1ED69_PRICU|nr:PREDICTED: RUN and FYVE domain-containing protein 1-like [Priapulus caudatus]